jgi:DNA-binding transcriptional regulator YhcF (GntR family)
VAVIVGVSIGGGLYISGFIFDGKENQSNNISNSKYSNQADNGANVKNLIALQCGYYSKEENAKELMNSISNHCQPFIVEDNGKYRVIAGIYKEDEGLKKIEEFKANNIDVAKISLNTSNNSLENKKIIEVIDGFLTIVNKLQDSEVKSIKTTEFKTWANKIIADSNYGKSDEIDKLSNYVSGLPDEIDKTNSNANMQVLYKLINTH